MTGCEEIRLSLGALVLSALEPDDERRVREHLARCPDCTAEVAELQRTVGILATAGPAVAPDLDVPAASPRVLHGLLAAVATERRRERRRRLAFGLAAAAAAAVVAGVAVAAIDDPPPPPPAATSDVPPDLQLRGAADHVGLDVDVWERGWGAAVQVDVWGVPGGATCSLVAVAQDGSREVAATWTVPSQGYDPEAGPLTVDGAVGMQADRLSHVEVVTSDGEVLVTAQA